MERPIHGVATMSSSITVRDPHALDECAKLLQNAPDAFRLFTKEKIKFEMIEDMDLLSKISKIFWQNASSEVSNAP